MLPVRSLLKVSVFCMLNPLDCDQFRLKVRISEGFCDGCSLVCVFCGLCDLESGCCRRWCCVCGGVVLVIATVGVIVVVVDAVVVVGVVVL